jgi:ferredoxin
MGALEPDHRTVVTLIDIQPPASFGVERKHAEAAGAKFLWPRFTKAITETAVELTNGDLLPADTVIMAVGDQPDLSFLPEEIKTNRGFVASTSVSETTQGLRHRRRRASGIDRDRGAGTLGRRQPLRGRDTPMTSFLPSTRSAARILHPRLPRFEDPLLCRRRLRGACRDCGLSETICPQNAISRQDLGEEAYEYTIDAELCIGCGFCAGACPCGIWRLIENDPPE